MAPDPARNEVVFNLWYVYDESGIIYFLLGRSYAGVAADAENLAMLLERASIDHRVAQYFPLPARFHTKVVEDSKERDVPLIHTSSLGVLGGPEVLFSEAILQLQARVHAMSGLALSQKPLVCITPLLLGVDGALSVDSSLRS